MRCGRGDNCIDVLEFSILLKWEGGCLALIGADAEGARVQRLGQGLPRRLLGLWLVCLPARSSAVIPLGVASVPLAPCF